MSKITKSAQGKPCYLHLDGCQSGGANETTVFAHLSGAGTGRKDTIKGFHWGMYACMNCHDIIDGRKPHDYEREWLELVQLRAVVRCQRSMVIEEVITA